MRRLTLDTSWVLPAGALAGLLPIALVAVGAFRRGRGTRIASPEEASDATEATLMGFRTVGAAVGSDGAAALVVDASDRVAVCRRRGARMCVREVGWVAIQATAAGLLVDTGEERSGILRITGVDALDVRRLRDQDDRSRASSAAM